MVHLAKFPPFSSSTPTQSRCTGKERGAFSSACAAQGCGRRRWQRSQRCAHALPAGTSSRPGAGAQRGSRGLITVRLLSARNKPWACIVHKEWTQDEQCNRRMQSLLVEMANKAFLFLLKKQKKKCTPNARVKHF